MNAEDMTYSEAYESYAQVQAKYYSNAKFSREVPWGYRNETREKLILELIASLNANSFLDLGCASGHTTLAVASTFRNMTCLGVDIGNEFINEARRVTSQSGLSNATFTAGDAVEFGFSHDKKYDCVLAAEIIEHVLQENDLCSSISRLLNKNGVVIFTTPNLNGDGTLVGRWGRLWKLRKFTPATDFTQSGIETHGDQHVREFSVVTLIGVLEANGFRVLKARGLVVLEFPFNDFLFKFIRRVPGLLSVMQELELWVSRRLPFFGNRFGKQLLVVAEFTNN
jgi:2-polyprenyl-3-methyl-5-hydroxy-6-metoxy-1,4-benzoquinol methylase